MIIECIGGVQWFIERAPYNKYAPCIDDPLMVWHLFDSNRKYVDNFPTLKILRRYIALVSRK